MLKVKSAEAADPKSWLNGAGSQEEEKKEEGAWKKSEGSPPGAGVRVPLRIIHTSRSGVSPEIPHRTMSLSTAAFPHTAASPHVTIWLLGGHA